LPVKLKESKKTSDMDKSGNKDRRKKKFGRTKKKTAAKGVIDGKKIKKKTR